MSIQKIGRYEIVKELGRGGMATVYLARDPSVNRQVAIKVLPPQFTHDPQFRARFDREAQVIASLEHTCIVPVYDFGQHGDMPYIVMRHLAGGDLADRLAKGPLTFKHTLLILQRLAAALDTAHKRGIIHRDLKPGNILFDADGLVYLSDFGIAKIAQESVSLSGTGMMIGTPEYMSPEQAMGQRALDHRSDLYALGIIAYEMLTGRHPYTADTPVGLMLKHVTEPVPVLDTVRYNLPPDCNPVVARALAKNPEERYKTVVEFVQALTVVGTARPAAPAAPAVIPVADPRSEAKGTPAPVSPPPVSPPPAASPVPPAAPPAQPAAPPPSLQPLSPTDHAHHALTEIPCANCAGAGLELQDDGQVTCHFCGTPNSIQGEICPACQHVNDLNADYCESCQLALIRYCPNCQTKNWSGLENCAVCGQSLDALAYLNERWQQNTPEGKAQQLNDIRAVKAAEEEAAQKRMAKMMAQEQQRQKEISSAITRRSRNESLLIALLIGGVVVIVLIVGLVVLFGSGGQ